MDATRSNGREREIFRYMKGHGYPVFHRSTIFLRDIQYGVRDYFREVQHLDLSTRESDANAQTLIDNLVRAGELVPFRENVWLVNIEEFLNPPKAEEKKEAAAA